jgi:hypothetical protein
MSQSSSTPELDRTEDNKVAPPTKPTLKQITAAILRDSAQATTDYLTDTEVPFGGE